MIHAPTVKLHSVVTPWAFHTWIFDLFGAITYYFERAFGSLLLWMLYKGVEMIAFKRTIAPVVENGQVEATNEILIRTLSQMVYRSPNDALTLSR